MLELPASVASLWPYTPRRHRVAQGEMHYVDEGPANPRGTLLLVHGNPTWAFHWRGLIAGLSHRYRMVAVDHLGCGRSEQPNLPLQLTDHIANLESLVESLDLQNVTLVAQDWGGAIGLGVVRRQLDRFRRVVLLNTAAFPPPYVPWRIAACRWPVVGRLMVQGANAFVLAALRMTLSRRRRLDPAVEQAYTAPYRTWTSRRQVYEFVRDIPRSPRDATWQELAATEAWLPMLANHPALLVWGLRDWCFRPECLDRFAAAWPQAEVHRWADVGHWVTEDAPEQLLPTVREFLERTDSSAV